MQSSLKGAEFEVDYLNEELEMHKAVLLAKTKELSDMNEYLYHRAPLAAEQRVCDLEEENTRLRGQLHESQLKVRLLMS